MSIIHLTNPPSGQLLENVSINNLNVSGSFIFDGINQNPEGGGGTGATGPKGDTGPQGATGANGNGLTGLTGAVLYASGAGITGDTSRFTFNDNLTNVTITKPSSEGTISTLLTLNSDPSGSHGFGAHLSISGNPAGGGTIFREDGGLNSSILQIYGGDYTGTQSSQIYLNGNNSSESGDPGSCQIVVGYNNIGSTGANFQVLAQQPSYNPMLTITDNNSNGIINIPSLTANQFVGTDSNKNLISVSAAVGPTGSQGIQGVTGATGSQGVTGAQGIQGQTGPSQIYSMTNNLYNQQSITWGIDASTLNYEYGQVFTSQSIINVSAFSIYNYLGMSTSHNIHLWNSTGTLLSTITSSSEISGQWNIVPLPTNLILPIGQYTLSYTANSLTDFASSTASYPVTYDSIILNAFNYSPIPATFPNLTQSTTAKLGIDLQFSFQLSNMGPQTQSINSISGSITGNTRVLYGVFNPSPSTVNVISASYGFLSASYNSLGHYSFQFTNPFINIPSVVVCFGNNNHNNPYLISAENITTIGFDVIIVNPTISYYDWLFQVIVMGS